MLSWVAASKEERLRVSSRIGGDVEATLTVRTGTSGVVDWKRLDEGCRLISCGRKVFGRHEVREGTGGCWYEGRPFDVMFVADLVNCDNLLACC